MTRKLWVAFGVLLAAALGAQAQQSTPKPDPADPAAAVQATLFASSLSGYTPAMKNGTPPPDQAWRAANDAVGGQAAHSGHEMAAPAASEAPRKAEPAAAPTQHKHH